MELSPDKTGALHSLYRLPLRFLQRRQPRGSAGSMQAGSGWSCIRRGTLPGAAL
jgi:hypothetical protein